MKTTSDSRVLAKFIAELRYADLPDHVVIEAKRRILDTIAAAYAGRLVNSSFNEAICKIFGEMGGKEESTVFFTGKKLPAANAAFVNASFIHGADLDDGHKTAQGHPAVVIIPAVLALAEAKGSSVQDIITAVVVGYEVYVRLSNAVMPSLFARGFHGTGVCGTVSAGCAAAKLLGVSPDEMHKALSFSALQAAGLFNISESGQMCKPINPARACHSGVLSALLCKEDRVSPPDEPLSGNKGFFHAFADETDPAALTQNLGKEYKILECYIKLYPACRHLHPAVDAGIQLHNEGRWNVEAVEKILLYDYPASIKSVGSIRVPRTEDDAKFSITYALAKALATGNYTFESLKEAAHVDPQTLRIIDMIELIEAPELENRAQNIRGSMVKLNYKDGATVISKVLLPKGEPEFPVGEREMRNKLDLCCHSFLTEDEQDRLYEAIMKLEEAGRIDEFLNLISK